MATKQIHSFLLLVSSNFIAKAAWAVSQFILVRCVGTNNFGILVTLWSISTITASSSDLGTSQVLLREGARQPKISHQTALQVQNIQIFLTIFLFFLLVISIILCMPNIDLNPYDKFIIIVTAIAAPLIDRFQYIYTVFCQVSGNLQIYAKNRAAYFLSLLVIFATMSISGIANNLTTISTVYTSATLSAIFIMAKKTWAILPRQHEKQVFLSTWNLIKEGFPYLSLSLLAIAYGRIEVTALGLAGYHQLAGIYHLTYQIILLFFSISGMLFTVTYPRLYRHCGKVSFLNEDFRDTVRWLALITCICFPLMFIYSDQILIILGGKEMTGYHDIFRILSCFILLLPGAAILNFLLPLDLQPARVKADIIGILIILIGIVISFSMNSPIVVAISSVTGYAVSIIIAAIVLYQKKRISTWMALSELFSIAKWSMPLTLIPALLPLSWWLGSFLYIMLLSVTLYLLKHPVSIRIHRILTAIAHENFQY